MAAAAFLAFGGVMAAHAAGPVSDAEMRQFADRANFTAVSAQVKYTRYIITYAQGSAERTQATARQHDYDRVAAETGLNVAHMRTLSTGAELVEVSGDKLRFAAYDESARQVLASFARNAAVEYVDPDRIMHALLTPNDTNFGSQWDLTDPTGGVNQTGAWDIATGSGIKVAVIDTGITPHTDLSGQTVGGYDFISSSTTARDGNGRDANPNDEGDWYASNECGVGIPGSNSSWHGTHVAGTVAALTNNASGVASMAYGAKVVPVRVLGKCGGTVADIVDAITWASGGTVSGVPANTNSAKVLSLSLGGGGACGSFQAAITGARSRGSVFVVAAGNENQNVTNSSPANCSGVISVAATTRAGARASYSNFGSTIVISAPGGAGTGGTADILSTLNTGTTTQGSQTYAYYAGTSMATPHVSALAAAIFSINSGLTPDQVKNYITANARPLPGSCSGGCGAGIINAQATLAAVSGGGSNVAPTANFSFTTSGLTANFTDTSTDSDGTIASRSWNFGDGGTSTATNPSHAYAAGGTYSVALTVTDDDGAPNTRTQSVTVSGGGGGTVLQNNVPVTGLAATTGNALTYTMTVPAGATNLVFQISGGTGDADMYVRYGSAPGTTAGTYDCRPYLNGNNETCTFASPTAGTWYVTLRAYSSFTGVTLRGSYNAGGGGGTVLQNNVPVTGLAATTGNSLNYTMTVPAGATNLQFRTSGGTGDADLYVRFNAAPTTSTYTCRSWANGNTENCTIAAPQAGTWYVMVRAYTTFSGVTLTGSYTP